MAPGFALADLDTLIELNEQRENPGARDRSQVTEGVAPVLARRNEHKMNQWPEAVYERVMNLFLEEIPGRVSQLKSAALDCDLDALAHVGHKIRGTTGVLGVSRINEIALAMERQIRNGQVGNAVEHGLDLARELERLRDSLLEEEEPLSQPDRPPRESRPA